MTQDDGGMECLPDAGQKPDGACVTACTTDEACGAEQCDETTGQCVACTEDGHCLGSRHCDLESHTCVVCRTDDDCGDTGASRCDLETHTCKACTDNGACAHLDETPVCDTTAGTCVGCVGDDDCTEPGLPACNVETQVCVPCNPGTEVSDCGGFETCDPLDHVCSGIAPGSVSVCGACRSDNDCNGDPLGVPGARLRCVEMTFNGAPHGDYGYCLLQIPPGTPSNECPHRYFFARTRTSRGGVEGRFCIPSENDVTCEAIRTIGNDCSDMEATDGGLVEIPNDDVCGAPELDDGLCRSDNGGALRCTYACGSDFDCPSAVQCNTVASPHYCCTSATNCPPM
jgi:hypothetical protein